MSDMDVLFAANNACADTDCDHTCVLTHTDNAASAAYRCMCQTGFQPSVNNVSRCDSTFTTQHSLTCHFCTVVIPDS